MAILDADTRVVTHGCITLGKLSRSKAIDGNEGSLPTYSMREVCDAFESSAIGMGVDRDGGKVQIKFKDLAISPCEGYATILFNVVNKRGASVVVRDTNDDSTEELPLSRPSQGYEASCHFVIDLTPDATTAQYKFAFEAVPKIPIARINSLFGHMLKRISDMHPEMYHVDRNFDIATDETAKKDILKFKSSFDITLSPDQDFMDELRNGVISNVKLIKYSDSVFNFADRSGVITAKKLSLEIESSSDRTDCITWLRNVASSELGEEYDQISFSFQQETGQRTAKMDLDNIRMEGLERIIVRKSILENFSTPLKDSYDDAQETIIEKIIEVM
ncbi:hypothetical protein BK412_21835 [Vibrio campbellii]|uniref:hypothetical protein n=1 Tax=Vibrio campbellii TaxID=680 RepID=UPI0009BE783F|nr:hypothetical protein [Vibrio campbellii]OQQ00556.1 hypothetical protein BK412_21835 [Vibrio campbellii]